MQVEIGKWGNSAALRVPAALLQASGITIGTKMNIELSEGRLILTPQKKKMSRKERREWLLSDLVEHGSIDEISSGAAQGNEAVEW